MNPYGGPRPHHMQHIRDWWATQPGSPQLARRLAGAAIAIGLLKRPAACQRCGGACRPQAHHEDYFKPLDVLFLCVPCHRARHSELLKAAKAAGQVPVTNSRKLRADTAHQIVSQLPLTNERDLALCVVLGRRP